MTREIKFRIWIENNKRMDFTSLNDLLYEDGNYYEYNGNVKDYPIMQYTGLKDKNGKEIYEGDIVEMNQAVTDSFDIPYTKGIVEFWRGQFVVNESNGLGCNLANFSALADINGEELRGEIIGNIYQNPKLLK